MKNWIGTLLAFALTASVTEACQPLLEAGATPDQIFAKLAELRSDPAAYAQLRRAPQPDRWMALQSLNWHLLDDLVRVQQRSFETIPESLVRSRLAGEESVVAAADEEDWAPFLKQLRALGKAR